MCRDVRTIAMGVVAGNLRICTTGVKGVNDVKPVSCSKRGGVMLHGPQEPGNLIKIGVFRVLQRSGNPPHQEKGDKNDTP